MHRIQAGRAAAVTLLLAVSLAGCKKQEQAVVQSARQAEQKAQAAATQRDLQRTELAKIPLPTKSMYINVHEPSQWVNPFISADADYLNLRVSMADRLGGGSACRQ